MGTYLLYRLYQNIFLIALNNFKQSLNGIGESSQVSQTFLPIAFCYFLFFVLLAISRFFSYLKHENLSEWFQKQACLTPAKIALSDKYKSYTFRELDDLTTLLAKYLIAKFGIKKNCSIITIYMEICTSHIIANIAIIKSGTCNIE